MINAQNLSEHVRKAQNGDVEKQFLTGLYYLNNRDKYSAQTWLIKK